MTILCVFALVAMMESCVAGSRKREEVLLSTARTPKKNARPKKKIFQDVEKTKKFDCNFSHRTQNDDDKNDDEFCSTRAEQVFVNTSERNVRVCVYVCI